MCVFINLYMYKYTTENDYYLCVFINLYMYKYSMENDYCTTRSDTSSATMGSYTSKVGLSKIHTCVYIYKTTNILKRIIMVLRGATISRLLTIIGLFCRIQSLSWGSFAKETYDFKEPTNRSHPYKHIPLNIWATLYSTCKQGGRLWYI